MNVVSHTTRTSIGLRLNDTHYECVIITREKQNRFYTIRTMTVHRDRLTVHYCCKCMHNRYFFLFIYTSTILFSACPKS